MIRGVFCFINRVKHSSEFTTTAWIADQSELAFYEVADFETVLDDSITLQLNNSYARELKVFDLLANGNKVLLPASAYRVIVAGRHGIK